MLKLFSRFMLKDFGFFLAMNEYEEYHVQQKDD